MAPPLWRKAFFSSKAEFAVAVLDAVHDEFGQGDLKAAFVLYREEGALDEDGGRKAGVDGHREGVVVDQERTR
jgi:hypothetical protein